MKTLGRFFELLFLKMAEVREPRAACYTCKDQIRKGDLVYYAGDAAKDYWCACCGTKIRVENGAHVCVFFQGLVPGEID